MPNDRRVGNLLVQMRAELGGLKLDVKEMQSTFQNGFNQIKSAAANLGNTLVASLGVGAIIGFGKSLVDLGHKFSNLHDETGLSIEVIGGLKPMVDQTGISIDQFALGILRAQKNLGGIHSEADPAAQALKTLGLNIGQMLAASPDEFLERFAKGLATVDDQNKRAALATQILGKAGAELTPVLLRIANEGLPRMSSEIARGYKALGDLKDQLIRITAETYNFWAAVSGKIAGSFDDTTIKSFQQQIETLSAYLVKMKNLMGDAFEDNPDMKAAQARLTGLQVVLEKMTAAAVGKGGKADIILGGDPQKIQSITEALNKQIAALQAQQIALTQGDAAGLRFRLSMQALDELGVKKLPPEIQNLINKLVGLSIADERAKLAQNAFFASFGAGDETLNRSAEAWRELGKMIEESVSLDPALRALNKEMEGIAAQAEAFGPSFDEATKKIEALKTAIKNMLSVPGATAKTPEISDKIAALQNQEINKTFEDLGKSMNDISAQAQVFGISFDDTAARIDKVKGAMIELINQGLDPADLRIQSLKVQFDSLATLGNIENSFRSLAGSIEGDFQTTLNGIMQGTQTFGAAMHNLFLKIAQDISNTMLKIALQPVNDWLSNIFGMVFKAIGAFFLPTPAPSTGLAFAAGAFGGGIPTFAGAAGGIVTRPTMSLIGEAGPEAIIPLSRMSGGGFGGITYNIYAPGAQRGVSTEILRALRDSEKRAREGAVGDVKNERMRSTNFTRTFSGR
jgi:hypothetical protein